MSEELKDLISKLLNKDPDQRPMCEDIIEHPYFNLYVGICRQGWSSVHVMRLRNTVEEAFRTLRLFFLLQLSDLVIGVSPTTPRGTPIVEAMEMEMDESLSIGSNSKS